MMLLHKKTQASRLPRHCARRALTFGVLILLGVLLVGFGRQSNVSAATPINSPSQHAEAGNDQKNADQVKAIVDDVLLKEAEIQGNISDEASSRLISTFGGYYYEGDHLVILVTDDVFAGPLEHALASIEPDFYTIRIVPHSLRELSAEVEKAFEYYQAKEASIDIATNAIVLGFDSQTVDSMTRTRNYPSSWKGIPVYVEESTVHEVVPAVQGNRNIASLKTQTVPNVRAFDYNYEGVHDASGYELWGGDGIGSASNVLCSMTIKGGL